MDFIHGFLYAMGLFQTPAIKLKLKTALNALYIIGNKIVGIYSRHQNGPFSLTQTLNTAGPSGFFIFFSPGSPVPFRDLINLSIYTTIY